MTNEQIADALVAACARCDAAWDAWKANQRSEALWAEYTSEQRTASDILRVHLPAILAALREPTAEQVERAAVALYKSMRAPHEIEWETEEEWLKDSHRHSAKAVLLAARSAP